MNECQPSDWPRQKRLFEPGDSLVGARLQQPRVPDPVVQHTEIWIAWTEADGLLCQWYHFVYRAGQEFAPTQIAIRGREVLVGGDRPFEFGNRLRTSPPNTKN